MSDLSYCLVRSCNLEELPEENENENKSIVKHRGHRRTISCDNAWLVNSKGNTSLPSSEKSPPSLPSYEEQSNSTTDSSIVTDSLSFQDYTNMHERYPFYKPKTNYLATPCSPPDSCLCHLSTSDCPPLYLNEGNSYDISDEEKCYYATIQPQRSFNSIHRNMNCLPVIDEVASDDNISYNSTLY